MSDIPADAGSPAESSSPIDAATPFQNDAPAPDAPPTDTAESVQADGGDPERGDSPWAADLAERFEDEGIRGQVDEYLREKVQPHVTKLEQGQAHEGHSQFFEDLEADPANATLNLLGEVYDTDDAGEAVFNLLSEVFGEEAIPYFEAALEYAEGEDEDDDGYGEDDEDGEFDLDSLPDEVREAIEWANEHRGQEQDQSEQQAFLSEVNELFVQNQEAFPPGTSPEQAAELIAPFVVTFDGDIDGAFEAYGQWKQALEGGEQPEAAAAAAAAGLSPDEIGPPATVRGGPSAAPPTQKHYGSIGEAAEDFVAELKARNNPPTL